MTKIIRSTALLTLITAFILSIGACKKDAAKSKTQLLTQSSWKVLKFENRTGSGAWIENTSVLACDKDNIFVFGTPATYEENEGATKCNPADPQIIITSTWTFLTNETQLQIPGGGGTLILNLDQLDESTMVLSEPLSGGATVTSRITLGH
jgi:hypothetical protein